jgi:ElaB/YqjD/DUF883 family membrane-anchored ribosome-binding protein
MSGAHGMERDDAESDAIRHEIERTRGDMSRTVNEIEERLSPAHIKEQVANVTTEIEHKVGNAVSSELRQARSAVRDATVGKVEHMVQDARESVTTAGTTVLDTIRANPIPASLIGIGLGWMLMSARRSTMTARRPAAYDRDRPMRRFSAGAGDRYGYRTGYGLAEGRETREGRDEREYARGSRRGRRRVQTSASEVMEGAQAKAHEVGEKVSHLADDAGHRVAEAATAARDAATHAAEEARERGRRMARDARQQVVRAERGLESSLRENPLAVSAIALAIGAAIGLSLPHTEVEDEWMGDARDRMLRRAEGLAGTAIEGAEQKASQLASGAQQEQPQQKQKQEPAAQGTQAQQDRDRENGVPSSRA